MHPLFETHILNADGLQKAHQIAGGFSSFLSSLELLVGPEAATGRAFSIVKTKLEEAAFFAKKAMAQRPENQQP